MNKTGLVLTLGVHGLVLLLVISGSPLQPKAQAAVLTTRLIPAAAAPVSLLKLQEPALPMPALSAPLPTPEIQINASAEPAAAQAAPAASPAVAIVARAAATTAPSIATADPPPPSSSYQPRLAAARAWQLQRTRCRAVLPGAAARARRPGSCLAARAGR